MTMALFFIYIGVLIEVALMVGFAGYMAYSLFKYLAPKNERTN